MSRFYTNIEQLGNNVLIREVQEDKKLKTKVEFQPTLYVTSKKKSKWTTVNGKFVEPIQPGTIQETRDWVKQYQNVPGFDIYGNTSYYYQWIAKEYPEENIDYDLNKIDAWSLDIEVESENGFPDPLTALERINVIAFRNIAKNKTYVFALEVYGQKFVTDDPTIKYLAFDDEKELLASFLAFWKENEPDVITGWSISFFDIPYIVNRAVQFFGEKVVRNSLSPWGKINQETIKFMEQDKLTYGISGVSILDYLRLYKKYTMDPRENFTLGYIASFELDGETKLGHDEYENFSEFYKNNFCKFVDYCIKDSLLIEKLEAKLKLMELTYTVAYFAHVNYEDVLSQVRTWDMLIYNYLLRKNVVIPFKSSFEKGEKYAGAYVKDPKPGLYKWVVSFDVTSLYPSIIKALNIGVESKVGRNWITRDPEKFLTVSEDYKSHYLDAVANKTTLSVNGVSYTKDKISFFSELTQKLFLDRKDYQKKYKECKAAGDANGASTYYLRQWATKIQLNSLYGAIGNQYFRFFDVENAEAVTLTGQFIIQYVERQMNIYLNSVLKTKDVGYVVYCDTDSVYITLDKLVESLKLKDLQETVDFVCKLSKEQLEPKIDKLFAQIERMLNAVPGHLSMKREVVADAAIWTAKKRYIVNVYDSEGDRYTKPKLKVMGIEIKKAVVPKFCRDRMLDAVKLILDSKDNEKVIDFIEKTKIEFNSLPSNEMGCPTGVRGIEKYLGFKSGCPLHTRGALVYNSMLDKFDLSQKYQKIQDGDRIKYILLKLPNKSGQKVIAFLNTIPKEFQLEDYFDVDSQFDKVFIKPLNGILGAIGWDYERKSTLSKWM